LPLRRKRRSTATSRSGITHGRGLTGIWVDLSFSLFRSSLSIRTADERAD
jgi:hypothetical protein